MTGYHQYKICIEACQRCAALCHHCAAFCIKEENASMMATHIQLTLECAAICSAAATLMSLGSEYVKDILKLCATMCDACAEACSKSANEHCLECAEACTKCADECEVV